MANIMIGGENLIRRSGVTLTAGSADANNPVANLQVLNPAVYCRLDDLTASHVAIDFGSATYANLVALLGCTATNRRNLLSETNNLDAGTNWSATNATVTEHEAGRVEGASTFNIQDSGAGSVAHYLSHTYSYGAYTRESAPIVCVATIEVQQAASSSHVRLGVYHASAAEGFYVDADLDNGTVNGSGSVSGAADDVISTSVTAVSLAGWSAYRVTVVGYVNGGGSGTDEDLEFRVNVLDSSFNVTYTAGTEAIRVARPKLSFGSATYPSGTFTGGGSEEAFEPNLGTVPGAWWGYKADGSSITPTSTALSISSIWRSVNPSEHGVGWDADIGWTNAWFEIPAQISTDGRAFRYALIEIHDQDNPDTYIDVSSIGIYNAFQPTKNFKEDWTWRWEEDTDPTAKYSPAGERRRIVTLNLHYLKKDEALRELGDILLHLGQSREGFFVLDPDETTHGQQMAFYGRITDHHVGPRGYSASEGALVYQAALTIRETVP